MCRPQARGTFLPPGPARPGPAGNVAAGASFQRRVLHFTDGSRPEGRPGCAAEHGEQGAQPAPRPLGPQLGVSGKHGQVPTSASGQTSWCPHPGAACRLRCDQCKLPRFHCCCQGCGPGGGGVASVGTPEQPLSLLGRGRYLHTDRTPGGRVLSHRPFRGSVPFLPHRLRPES